MVEACISKKNCPNDLYKLMKDCWIEEPEDRHTFEQVLQPLCDKRNALKNGFKPLRIHRHFVMPHQQLLTLHIMKRNLNKCNIIIVFKGLLANIERLAAHKAMKFIPMAVPQLTALYIRLFQCLSKLRRNKGQFQGEFRSSIGQRQHAYRGRRRRIFSRCIQ